MSEQPNYTPQPGQWQPTYPPAPPVKQQNWFMRHKIITGILGLIIVGGLAGALGGGGDTPSAPSEQTAATSASTGAASPGEAKVDADDVGNEANPVTIVEGKAFDVRKFSYAAGWKITSSDFGMELKNLKLTNNRGERDSAFVQIKFMKATEVLATIDCSSDQILPGQTVTLSCFGTEPKPTGHDRITINDTF